MLINKKFLYKFDPNSGQAAYTKIQLNRGTILIIFEFMKLLGKTITILVLLG